MKILDNEGELIVDLTDVKDEKHLESLLNQEDTELTDVMFETSLFAMSLKDYEEWYGSHDFTEVEVKTCDYESWMSEVREWAKSCLAACE